MNNTYILLARSLLESEVFASQKMLKIWIWCLLKANYKDKKVPITIGRGESIVEVKRGQFLFGRFRAEEELFIDGSTIYKIMKKLEQLGNISIKSSSHYSIVTILNYDSYQNPDNYKVTTDEQPSNSRVTAKEQPSNTTKKEKKDNNIKNYIQWRDNSKDQNYIYIVNYILGENELGDPLDGVLKMDNQITEQKFQGLLTKSKKNGIKITDKLNSLESKLSERGGKKYTDLCRTLNNWLQNKF